MADDTQPVYGAEYTRNEAKSPYLNSRQAADYCNISVKTLYNRRREIRSMPGVGKLLFRREELDRWLATRRSN
jgi:hypothetical protein